MKNFFGSLVAAILAATLVLPSCTLRGPEKITHTTYDFFDTVSVYTAFSTGDPAETEAVFAKADALFSEYHKLFDIYHEYDGMNNLATLNRMAGKGPVALDGKALAALSFALEICELTGGECNPVMGAVLSLWHEAREFANEHPEEAALPDAAALSEAAKHVDPASLAVDLTAGTAELTDPLASVDLGAVGKGYATEMVARALAADGVTGFALDIGANLRVIGSKPDGSPWVAGVRNPDTGSENRLVYTTELTDASLVTSGGYERYFTVGGVRYAHVIDKDTNEPPRIYASVSILCADSGVADALSTAFFCMEKGQIEATLGKLSDPVTVILVYEDGRVETLA